MPGWMQHKLESGLPRDISKNHKYVDDTTLMAQSKETKEPLDESERRVKKLA